MKRFSLAISLFLTFVIVCGILVLLDSLFDKRETQTNLFYHYYSIEPESLLDALKTGKVDVFSPVAEEPSSIPLEQQMSVPWTQDDYFRIANALYNFIWGETLNGWQLKSMDFASSREESAIGFQDGNFEFFKILKTDDREARLQLIVNIRPKDRYVFITKNEYYPILTDWSSIDSKKNNFSASEILQIAENTGGKAKRLSVGNACHISMWLSPNSARYKGWSVHYAQGNDTLFRININPFTGEVYNQ